MKVMRLSQLITNEPAVRKAWDTKGTELRKACLAGEKLFSGFTRICTVHTDENGRPVVTPPTNEEQRVQMILSDQLAGLRPEWSEMIDVMVTKNSGNTKAFGEVKVDDEFVLPELPVQTIIDLEKKVQEWRNQLLTILVVLPTDTKWVRDPNSRLHVSDSSKSPFTQRKQVVMQLAKATDKHPEQVQLVTEDVACGEWTRTKFHGGMSAEDVFQIVARADKLLKALRVAREEANTIKVDPIQVGESIFDYVVSGKTNV